MPPKRLAHKSNKSKTLNGWLSILRVRQIYTTGKYSGINSIVQYRHYVVIFTLHFIDKKDPLLQQLSRSQVCWISEWQTEPVKFNDIYESSISAHKLITTQLHNHIPSVLFFFTKSVHRSITL